MIWVFASSFKVVIALITGVVLQTLTVLYAAIGDATLGAIIAGVFLLINTCLTLWLSLRFTRREREEWEEDHREGDTEEAKT